MNDIDYIEKKGFEVVTVYNTKRVVVDMGDYYYVYFPMSDDECKKFNVVKGSSHRVKLPKATE